MNTRYRHAIALPVVLALLAGVGCNTVRSKAAFKDGNRFYKEENWRRAIEQYERAIEFDPSMAEAHFYLASAQQSLYRPNKENDPENKARLDQAHASYAVSRNQSGYTVLHADYDGVITAITAEAGQVVAAGQAVMRLARPEEKEVVISVPESRLAEIRKATQVSIALWADPEKFYRARIREISPNADAATRTFTAKVSVIDSNPAVALGMTAVVLLGLAPVGDVIMLPLTALTQDNGKPAVWVVDQQSRQVGLKQVQIAQYRENGAVISGGLKSGEIVVTAGVHKLLAGQKVQVLDEAPVASATPAAPKP